MTENLKTLKLVSCVQPFAINRRELDRLFGSAKLARELVTANWIDVVRAGKPGRETLFDFGSARTAYDRYRAGELPTVPLENVEKNNTGGTK
jgi:hypothetical protein